MTEINRNILNTKEAAQYLSLAEKTLRNLRSRGGGPKFIRIFAGSVGYRVSDLDEWIENRQYHNTSEY